MTAQKRIEGTESTGGNSGDFIVLNESTMAQQLNLYASCAPGTI